MVGGGNSAAEESLFLTRFASKVTIVARGKTLTASSVAQNKVLGTDSVSVRYETGVVEFRGKDKLSGVVLRDLASGKEEEVHPAAVFVFIGLKPNTSFLKDVVDLNESGFIVTTATMETSMPGVYAAGDARAGSTKQLVSAAGEGATAALMIRQYLQSIHEVPSSDVLEQEMAAKPD